MEIGIDEFLALWVVHINSSHSAESSWLQGISDHILSSALLLRRNRRQLPTPINMSTAAQFIEHVVLFKVKPDIDPHTVANMLKNINTLTSIETVLHLTAGPIMHLRSPSYTFTHMIYIRFATEAHLKEFAQHPTHCRVVSENRPNLDDVMAMDWWHSAESVTIPQGSTLRVSLLKLKEGLEEKEKNEVLRVIGGMKEKFPSIELLSFGENFIPDRAKGFSIGSVYVFKGASELEKFDSEWEAEANEQKDVVRAKVEEAIVFDYVMP